MHEKIKILVPANEIRREKTVMNSKFITTIAPAGSVEAARMLIDRVHKEFPDANHHVTAFIIGHGASQTAHCSDAGEPAGSAGRPSLAVLQGSGLGDVVVVITRFFGGTKLGVGGLVRAYGDAVRNIIKDVPMASKFLAHIIKLEYDYSLVDRIRQVVSIHSGQALSEDFGIGVIMMARFPVENLPDFEHDLAELTSGKVKTIITETSEYLQPFKN
jgi:uncharacterized YigZ family protein